MTKKQIQKKLKSQKGLTGADVLIALLIILTSISIIGMVYLNINTIARITNAKTGATRIATNLIENIKGSYYDRVQSTTIQGDGSSLFNTKIPKGYSATITINEFEQDNNNLAKEVTVKVIYNKNDVNDAIELSTVIEREIVRECNSPNFSDEYVEELVGENKDYQMYQNLESIVSGKKIICPIKYNGENYVIVTGNDVNDLWYSYSDKQWARVLVFDDSTDLQEYINTESNTVSNAGILKDENKSFIWIPRYKVDTENNIYFMYKNTDCAIMKHTANNKIYNYINASDETLNNELIEKFTETAGGNPVVGQWVSYYSINDLTYDEIVRLLYNSKYGPLFEI